MKKQKTFAKKVLVVAVSAALPILLANNALAVTIGTTVPVGGAANGNGGYINGTVTLGDGTTQEITGGFLPRVDQTNNYANIAVNGASLVTGRKYFVQAAGTTDFTSLGASSNAVGTSFFYNGATLSGTGVVTDSANVIGGYNSLDNLNLLIKANTTIEPATSAAVLVEDDNIEGLITQKNYSIAVMTNGGATVVNYGRIVNADGGQSSTSVTNPQATNVAVQLGNDGDRLIVKSGGAVEASVSVSKVASATTTGSGSTLNNVANTAKAYGVNTDAAGAYFVTVEQGGSITATHGGIGGAYAIDGGGSSNEMTIENAGTISGTRLTPIKTSTITGNNVLATALKAQLNSTDATVNGVTTNMALLNAFGAQSIGNVAAVYVQEELGILNLNNRNTGVLETTGDLTDTLYLRATEQNVNNEGTIRVNGYTASNKNGMAIASVSDSMRLQKLNLDNSGDITGDIAVVNGNALRYWAITKYGVAGDELKINSGAGQIDSAIDNSGTITGDLWFSNGQHSVVNTGTIIGKWNIDQRDTVCGSGTASGQTCGIKANSITDHVLSEHLEYTVGADNKVVNDTNTSFNGNFTVHGNKDFTLASSGTITGDVNFVAVTGQTSTYTNVYGDTVTKENSTIALKPGFTTAGASSAANAAAAATGFINGTLTIRTYASVPSSSNDAAATTTTLAPQAVGITVKSGDWYKVATTYTNAGTDLPTVTNTPLVTWTAAKSGNALVVGATAQTASQAGLTGNDANVVNGLLTSNLGGIVQNMTDVADIKTAVQTLRPEISGATYLASAGVTDKVFGLVGSRLDEIHLASIAGRSGVATGDETRIADGTGVWMQAFGAKGSQDRRAGVDGYNTDAYGFAIGADQLIDDETRVGAVGSYGQSTVAEQGVNLGNRTSIDSYQGAIYASTLLRKLYLNATIGLGYHDYTGNRLVLGSGVKGSHDAWQYSAKLDAGYPIKFSAVTLVPVASLAYSHLAENGYSEAGNGALSYDSRDTDSFRTGLGAKALVPLLDSTVSAGLELRALWNHEFGDASIDTTARFVDGGASFTTNGISLERDSANLGASLRLFGVMDGVKQSLNVNYDAD
jgi:outer membrane autotransporter protein